MATRQITQEIFASDCVGDSAGKHNYNLLSLDSIVCNLSSKFFTSDNSYVSMFTDFANNTAAFMGAANVFFDSSYINAARTTTNLLSGYWESHEFTVHYPLNITTINTGMNLSSPTVNQPDDRLKSLALSFLTKNYPCSSFNVNAISNVVFFLFNTSVTPTDPYDLISISSSPTFSYMTRYMYVEYVRQSIHLANGKIFKFYNNGKKWVYLKTLTGNTVQTPQPNLIQKPYNPIPVAPKTQTGRSSISLSIDVNTTDYDVFKNAVNTGKYYAGATDITVTVDANVYVGSSSSDTAALIVSNSFSQGDSVTIINNGSIVGTGGGGGNGETKGYALNAKNNGEDGGDAISLGFYANIINNGLIAGGGGGGAGGLAYGLDALKKGNGGGGGGGAGYRAGTGGAGFSTMDPLYQSTYGGVKLAGNGSSGSKTTGGSGGNAGIAITAFANQGTALPNGKTVDITSNNGGSGGDLGKSGTSTGLVDSRRNQLPPVGGKAGKYLKGKFFANWVKRGNVLGNIS